MVVDRGRQRLDLLDAEDVVTKLVREARQPHTVGGVDGKPPFGNRLLEGSD